VLREHAGDFPIVGRDLGDEHLQLRGQSQHQARLGPRDDGIGRQVRLPHALMDLARLGLGRRIARRGEDGRDPLHVRRPCRVWRRERAQEGQRRALVQLAEQLQGDGVVRFQARRELVDQPRLGLDQAVLVTREHLELGDEGAVRRQAPQVGQIAAPCARQQVGVDGVGLRAGGLTLSIDGLRVDRVD